MIEVVFKTETRQIVAIQETKGERGDWVLQDDEKLIYLDLPLMQGDITGYRLTADFKAIEPDPDYTPAFRSYDVSVIAADVEKLKEDVADLKTRIESVNYNLGILIDRADSRI